MPTPDSLEPTAEPRDRPGETPTPGSRQHNPYAGWIVTPLIVIALIVLALWIPYELEKSERQRQMPPRIAFEPGTPHWIRQTTGEKTVTATTLRRLATYEELETRVIRKCRKLMQSGTKLVQKLTCF